MKFRYWRQARWQVVSSLFLLAAVIVSFQNCGKGTTSGMNSGSGGQVNMALKSAPSPVEVSINEISYMSCPMSGANSQYPDPLANPYYRFRFGAFDNSSSNKFLYYKDGDHVGGIGISKEAMDYFRRSTSNPTPGYISNFLNSSPYSNNMLPVAALIYKDRSPDSLAWTAMATPFLDNISGSDLNSSLSNAIQLGGKGTKKLNYFPSFQISKRNVIGSLNYGKSEADEILFRQNLSNQYLFFGFANSTYTMNAASIVQHLSGPDSNVTQRLHGRAFSFDFIPNQAVISQVHEYDLNSSSANPTDLTSKEGQIWECLPMTVVRNLDRSYWTTQAAVTVDGVSLAAGSPVLPAYIRDPRFGPLTEQRFKDAAEAANVFTFLTAKFGVIPTGVFYLCPSEDPEGMTAQERDLLKIVRRFLPADLYEVNIRQRCVVPKDKAISLGAKCYTNGEADEKSYVVYASTNCGPTSTVGDCAAKANFCWRRH